MQTRLNCYVESSDNECIDQNTLDIRGTLPEATFILWQLVIHHLPEPHQSCIHNPFIFSKLGPPNRPSLFLDIRVSTFDKTDEITLQSPCVQQCNGDNKSL